MKTRRTPFVLATAVISLGLLAACSDEADEPADAPLEQQAPVPGTAPQDSAPPTSAPVPPTVPDSDTTTPVPPAVPDADATTPPPIGADPADNYPMNPAPESLPSTSSVEEPGLTQKLAASGQAFQESAANAASAVGEKAGELRDATGERMSQVGQAIRDGAARADETIQESLNHQGGEPTTNPQPTPANN